VINNHDFGQTDEGNNSTAHGTIGPKKDGIDSSQMLNTLPLNS